jgi:two-component system cell cycle sensor histidine kinase/response regulator CckA
MADELQVLLVEDSENDARLLLRELERGGYRVRPTRVDSARAVEEALDRQSWDIVISDFSLPGYAGTVALEAVRSRGLDVPFLFVSGTIGEDRAVQAMKDGANDYILKDNLTRLLPAVQRELREAHSRRERRRTEALLAQSEARYRALFDANPVPLWVFSLETLRILAVNQAAIDQYGYTRDEFLGMTIMQLRPAEDAAPLVDQLARPRSPGFHMRGRWRHRRKDGGIVTVEIASHHLSFEGQRAQLVVANDISERARTEQAQAAVYRIAEAAHTAEDLEALFRSVHEIIGTLMPAKNLYVALHDAATDLITFPYFVDEVDPPPPSRRPGKGITDYVLRTGEPLLVKPETTLAGEESVGTPSIDWLGVPLKGHQRTIGVIAVQTYTPGVRYEERDKEMLQFVSTQIAAAIERRRGAEEARASAGRLSAILQAALDAHVAIDDGGRITSWNRQAEAMFGWAESEVRGKLLADTVVPAEHRSAHAAGLRRFLASGDGPILNQRIELNALRRDGSEFPVELAVAPVRVGTSWLFSAFIRDVTARREAEETLRKSELQLRQAQKMEAVGRLAGGIAHDFNNVLTAVFGYVDLLCEELPPESGAQSDLAEVRKAAERAAGLTRQLLAFSRQQVLEPVVLGLNDLMEDFEKMLRRVIGEDVQMRLSLAKDAGNVRADPGQLHQVIMNLAVNARDAMPTGGTLILETSNTELTEQYAELHQPVVPGRYVMLAVSDTGTGMSPEVRARIFEPFYTTKEQGKGTGLGLSTVYGIVKQSGGYIWVYSEVGRGTSFKIYLPRVDAPAQAIAKPKESPTLEGQETILLAEDDDILRPLARALLQKLGYTVLEGNNAQSALAAARAHTGPIHLLVADVVMPGESGRDLARRLAETRPATKVLYVSGYTDDAIVHHGMLETGLNFLQKPFTPAVLARKVREVLENR